MLSIRLDISFVMLLLLFSTVSISLLKSNHASAISVGGILGIAKDAMDIFPSLVSAAQSLGILPKPDTHTTTPPSPSSDADYKQLRQELETKFNTLSAQLAALNENDRQKATEQLAQTFKEALKPYSAPEQSFILNTTKELAPQGLQNLTNCVANAPGGAGGTAIASNGGSANAPGGAGGTAKCGPG